MGWTRRWALSTWGVAIIGIAASACATNGGAGGSTGGPVVKSASDADAKLGTRVRVVGRAANAKISAYVESEGFGVYLVEVSEWPAEIVGKRVEATGVVARNESVVAATSATGEVSAGTAEPVYVLREASYLLLDE